MPERAEGDKGVAPNNNGSDKSAGVPPIDSGCPIEVNSIAHYTVCTICNCGVPPNANRIGRHLRESYSSIYRTKEVKNIVAGIVNQLNKLPSRTCRICTTVESTIISQKINYGSKAMDSTFQT
jgi:hypothetical protein